LNARFIYLSSSILLFDEVALVH